MKYQENNTVWHEPQSALDDDARITVEKFLEVDPLDGSTDRRLLALVHKSCGRLAWERSPLDAARELERLARRLRKGEYLPV